MRKIVWLCGVILLLSVPAMAQDLPKFDVFGGYSYVHVSFGGGGGSSSSGNVTANLNGGSGAVAFYPSKHFGFVGDFGGYKLGTLKQGSSSASVSGSIITYLFGPRIRFGGEKATPFAQVLFGGAHIGDVTSSDSTICGDTTLPCKVITSRSAFAMTAGGGVDIKVSHHFSIRGQAEYLMTRFNSGGGGGGSGTGSTSTQNNARISVGIVIH